MPDNVPDFIEPVEPKGDKLDQLREAVAQLRDKQLEKEDLEARAADLGTAINVLNRTTLPELFAAAGVRNITLEASGNVPAYDAKLATEYRAGIPNSWEPEKREAGFNWLIAQDGGDLIKTVVTIEFEKGDVERAMTIRKALIEQHGIAPEDVTVDMTVHHATLTSYLRELVDGNDGSVPEGIDKIGGYVGPVVKLTKAKEPKSKAPRGSRS